MKVTLTTKDPVLIEALEDFLNSHADRPYTVLYKDENPGPVLLKEEKTNHYPFMGSINVDPMA